MNEEKAIYLNQVGFLPESAKLVYFKDDEYNTFEIVDDNEKVVYKSKIIKKIDKNLFNEIIYVGNFSSFKQNGIYYIRANNKKSFPFVISENVYNQLIEDVLKMLYLQRCGYKLSKDIAGDFAHEKCHIGKALIVDTEEYIDVTGGWHDAGDYGRYIVPGAKTVIDLLLAYISNPEFFENVIISNQSNMPDILEEIKYEIDWMFKMQRLDGAVYHKVTCKEFPDLDIMPEDETQQLYVSPISTTATADFSIVAALASVIYKKFDKEFSKKCLSASIRAYNFISKNPNIIFKNPTEIITGEYPDSFIDDELFVSAVALYVATKEAKYKIVIDKLKNNDLKEGLGWDNFATYGSIIYLTFVDAENQDIREKFLKIADEFVNSSKSDSYNISLSNDYPWGSNMIVANNAVVLMYAYEFSGNKEYKKIAQMHLNYLLGANPMSICYVTGYGCFSPLKPHHRPSIVKNKAMKGMLVGGPSMGLQDDLAKIMLKGKPPAKCYIDNELSYSTNEICIYWNSPLILLLAKII